MSLTMFTILIFGMAGLLLLAIRFKKYRVICLIAVAVLGFMMIATSPGGFGSGSRSMNHYCTRCGKRTSMSIDGSYYCFIHYNQRLFLD